MPPLGDRGPEGFEMKSQMKKKSEAQKTRQKDFMARLLEDVAEERKPLGEVAELKRGKTITAKTKTAGDIPVISGGQSPAYYNAEFNRDGETITVAGSGAYAGFVMYWNEPIFVSDAFSVKPDLAVLSTRYVFHSLLNNWSIRIIY